LKKTGEKDNESINIRHICTIQSYLFCILFFFELLLAAFVCVWLGSLMVTCWTCNPEVTQGRRFDAAPGHCRVATLGKLFTHMCLCHQAV